MSCNILHFTTEFGASALSGIGTFMQEMLEASSPRTRFIHIGSSAIDRRQKHPRIEHAEPYELDKLQALSFDVAVFHFYGLAYLADPSFLQGRKLIFVVHSVPTTEPWSLLDPYGGNTEIAHAFEMLCDRACSIVCVSEAERGKLLLLYPDLAPKTSVILNGMSSFPWAPADVRPEAERTAFGFLGRCDYRKGLRELLREFQQVRQGRLQIACSNDDEAYLLQVQQDALQHGISANIRFWGPAEGHVEKIRFLSSLDALIVPSRWEPFGFVVLEALRAGIPPMISTQGGMSEIVGESYRYQFDPFRPGALAYCIGMFQSDPKETVEAQIGSARFRAGALTAERMTKAYEKLAADTIVTDTLTMDARAADSMINIAQPAVLWTRRFAHRHTTLKASERHFRFGASSTPPLPE